MDAFSVSVANAIHEPEMKSGRMALIAGCFAFFQTGMPLLGWLCVRLLSELFHVFLKFVPWIAFVLLLYLGIKMLIDGLRSRGEETETKPLTIGALLLQGVATSIDAVSTGFVIAEYSTVSALTASLIIGAVTFVLCYLGLRFGKAVGTRFSHKATIVGGVILIAIGIEILLKSLLSSVV